MTKREYRFFTIADFREEEAWLRAQHNSGWKLSRFKAPCFFIFESCEPEDVIYRLDYKNRTQTDEYMQMCSDFGWEYCEECLGWLYFRKPAAEAENGDDGELFSDNESRVEMISHIVKTRMLPLLVIFLCCVVPGLRQALNGNYGGAGTVFTVFFCVMFVLYMYLFIHCGRKLKAMRDECGKK